MAKAGIGSVGVALAAVCFSTFMCGAEGQNSEMVEVKAWRSLLVSDVEHQRRAGKDALLNRRKETIEYLLRVINQPVKHGEDFGDPATSRNTAIYLLGQLRAKEAAADLTGLLLPKPGQVYIIGNVEAYLYSPAARSLIEIGLPSMPALLERLKSEGSDGIRVEWIKVIVAIIGLRQSETLLEDLFAIEKDEKKQTNIESAQALLGKPKLRKIFENIDKRRQRDWGYY